MMNLYLSEILNEQQNLADFRAKSYTIDSTGQKKPQRTIYTKLYGYFDDYIDSQKNPRWINITGVRGSGKTTLLFQLYNQISSIDCDTLFLSIDHTYGLLRTSLRDILAVYEKSHHLNYQKLDRPFVLFLDETQYDPDWFVTLQDFFDYSDQIFVFVSGSTLLRTNLNNSTDKRIIHEKIYPMSSPEYINIIKQKFQIAGLGESIRDAILYSDTSESLYTALQHLTPEINTYYKGSLQSDFYRYFCYGSLPYILDSGDESEVYLQIQDTIDRILIRDLPIAKFHPETVSMIPAMLFELACMDHYNVKRMAQKFGLSRSKMSEILDVLESVELLRRIYPYGLYASEVVSRKPSKYLFSTPIFRSIYLRLISDIISNESSKNKITEDFVAMYLYQVFDTIGKGTLMYDTTNDGADFVLMIDEIAIIIQIGSGLQGSKQIIQTRKNIPSKYGIIITENQLAYDSVSGIIHIPLRMFLLM